MINKCRSLLVPNISGLGGAIKSEGQNGQPRGRSPSPLHGQRAGVRGGKDGTRSARRKFSGRTTPHPQSLSMNRSAGYGASGREMMSASSPRPSPPIGAAERVPGGRERRRLGSRAPIANARSWILSPWRGEGSQKQRPSLSIPPAGWPFIDAHAGASLTSTHDGSGNQSCHSFAAFEERAEIARCLHGWEDDAWDRQMKRDLAECKLNQLPSKSNAAIHHP